MSSDGLTSGDSRGIFPDLTLKRGDSPELVASMERTVNRLLRPVPGGGPAGGPTSGDRPAMLLGRIQSGKTRSFIGIIAKGFDEGVDFAIVLTKGTSALSEQTVKRIKADFREAIEREQVLVFDIMHLPRNLTGYHLRQKWVIIAKKQKDNLRRIFEALKSHYPDLQQKRLLIIDDEADYASLTYKRDPATEEIEPGKIARWVDDLRRSTASTSFLQVTATPYSLFLQPDDAADTPLFHPVRPAFTELLPNHDSYVGGEFFFGEIDDAESPAHYVYEEVPQDERELLKKPDRRVFRLEEALTSRKVAVLTRALVTFVVGGWIRRRQEEDGGGGKRGRYSFIVHTEHSRGSHAWQAEIVRTLVDLLISEAGSNSGTYRRLVSASHEDLSRSLRLSATTWPALEETLAGVRGALIGGEVMVSVVNSDNQVRDQLDEEGQLRLDAPFNVFIGGQILDRGVTIRNLIGFYYGRSPQHFQQDTVLQHARLYGARPRADLLVTRFYTTSRIHQVMLRIHEFDSALREAVERDGPKAGVYFIRKDDAGVLAPCSPNKILVSDVVTLRAHRRLLPIGFQAGFKSHTAATVLEVDRIVHAAQDPRDAEKAVLVSLAVSSEILRLISTTLSFEDDDYKWDFEAHIAALNHLSERCADPSRQGMIWMFAREGRDLARFREERRFSNAPDSYQEIKLARATAIDLPCLALIRQDGRKEQGWNGAPFWWPIITPQKSTLTSIFASKTRAEE